MAWWEKDPRRYEIQQLYSSLYRMYLTSNRRVTRITDLQALLDYRIGLLKRRTLLEKLQLAKKKQARVEKGMRAELPSLTFVRAYWKVNHRVDILEQQLYDNYHYLAKLRAWVLSNNTALQDSISWDALTELPSSTKGRQHKDHPLNLLGDWTNHPLVFLPSQKYSYHESELTKDPDGPSFKEARRCLAIPGRPTFRSRPRQHVIFVSPHPGIVPEMNRPKGFQDAILDDLARAKESERGLEDLSKLKIELKAPGYPVIGMGTQTAHCSGYSKTTKKKRPQTFTLDLDGLQSPIYWSLADKQQTLAWFGHWRYITAAASAIQSKRDYPWISDLKVYDSTLTPSVDAVRDNHNRIKLLYRKSYKRNLDQWGPIKADDVGPTAFDLIEVREELRILRDEGKASDDPVRSLAPESRQGIGDDALWTGAKCLYRNGGPESRSPWKEYTTPVLVFELVRYGIFRNKNDKRNTLTLPVALKHTNGWLWRLPVDAVTQELCCKVKDFAKATFEYICKDGDRKFSNLSWINKRRILYPFRAKSKSLRDHVEWNHIFKPHLTLLDLVEERALWEEPEVIKTPRRVGPSRTGTTPYDRKLQLLDAGLLRFHSSDWPIQGWDDEHDPTLARRRRKAGAFGSKEVWKELRAQDLGTWAQVRDDLLKVRPAQDPSFQDYSNRDRKRIRGNFGIDLFGIKRIQRTLRLSQPKPQDQGPAVKQLSGLLIVNGPTQAELKPIYDWCEEQVRLEAVQQSKDKRRITLRWSRRWFAGQTVGIALISKRGPPTKKRSKRNALRLVIPTILFGF